jgi:hypothetical protein
MTDEELKIISSKDKFVGEYRGQIINIMVMNECLIDDIIAKYYCGNNLEKRREFIHTILGQEQFGLMRKKEIIMYILTNNFPDFLEKNKSLNENNGFGSYFNNLVELRNICAHRRYISSITPIEPSDEFCFSLDHYSTKSHKLKIQPHVRKESETANDIRECLNLRIKLQEIKTLIGLRVSE